MRAAVPQTWMTRAPEGVFAGEVVPRLLAASTELLLDVLPPLQPQMRLLEVGGAGGVAARALIERIAGLGRLVVAETDPALAHALPTAPRRAARVVAGLPLPVADGAFDVVLSNLALGGDDDDAWFAAVRRALKPRGRFVATAFVRGSWDALFDVLDEAAARGGLDVVGARLRAARAALPDVDDLAGRAAAAGFAAAVPPGVEERLVGFVDAPGALWAEPLVPLLVAAWCGDGAPARTLVDDVVRARFPEGFPLVARTAVFAWSPA
jgi:SAM-dependent methyltransferase